MSRLRIWLDDDEENRKTPKGYNYRARTAEEVIGLIKKGMVEMVSLDNDLGKGYTEGKRVAQFIEENYIMGRIEFVDFFPHTANQIAFEEILACKRSIIKHINSKK